MKKVIKITESQLKKLIIEQNLNEFHDEDEDYYELDNLFTNIFDTEDDYDGEMLRGDDEGFSIIRIFI